MSLFVVFAIIMTAGAVALVVVPLLRDVDARPNSPVAATVMAISLPSLVLLFYVGVSNHDWNDSGAGSSVASNPSPGALDDAVASLEARLSREPQDLDGWLLLGRTYFELQNFPQAKAAFQRALDLGGGTDAKLGFAEAEILIDRNNLTGQAGRLVEEVLQAEPDNSKALFYGGLVASARQDFAATRRRWERLLELSPPNNVREMLEQQLAMLPPGPDQPVPAQSAPATDAGINVRVDIASELKSRIKPGAMLFLVARAPERPGPPVAVVRQGAAAFPTLMRISDANAMLPGQSLGQLERIHFLARVANGGDAIAKPGDIFGEVYWSSENQDPDDPVSIVMNQIVESQ